MNPLKPKAQHEKLLAHADQENIMHYLEAGQEQAITKIAVMLAYQCTLYVHFQRLWHLRVADLDPRLNTEAYTRRIFVNRRALYKELK